MIPGMDRIVDGDRIPESRIGHGRAWGAVTILNATATGHGCSLAVDVDVTAQWTWTPDAWAWEGTVDDRVARAVRDLVPHPEGLPGARAGTKGGFPPARGLKTSSSSAAALVQAAHAAAGRTRPPLDQVRDAVAACRAAGVTLTGAFDDQAATTLGGCHLTDNHAGKVLATILVPDVDVAVWIPDHGIPKEVVAAVDTTPVVHEAREAERLLRANDVPGALTRNGAAFLRLYQEAGLPVDGTPVQAALDAGALGAGLSGTGPAVAALFESPRPLPEIQGGTWVWTRPVEAV